MEEKRKDKEVCESPQEDDRDCDFEHHIAAMEERDKERRRVEKLLEYAAGREGQGEEEKAAEYGAAEHIDIVAARHGTPADKACFGIKPYHFAQRCP